MRVLKVAACPFPVPRGTPVRIYHMAEALARAGHAVEVVTYHLGDDRPTSVPIVRIANVPGYRRTTAGPSYGKLLVLDPLLVLKVRERLRRYPFDVIHAHHYEGLLVALAARGFRDIPVLYDAHTLLSGELPFYPLGVPLRVLRSVAGWLDRTVPRRADAVIAVSEEIRRALVGPGGTASERTFVVPNGVERFDARRAPADGPRTVAFAGNLAPYQGVDFLLEAFARLRALRDDVRLRVILTESSSEVGRPRESGEPSLGSYEARARELGVLPFLDVVRTTFDELPSELARASVAVNPRGECPGIPQKLLNYMAAGAPIVSFAGSAKAIVHGKTGWVVPDGDVAAFAAGIDHLLGDDALAEELGRNARDEARVSYSWDGIARKVGDIYDGLVRGFVMR
jgi:glycosyltransferase involved in cell wall biosynthesis